MIDRRTFLLAGLSVTAASLVLPASGAFASGGIVEPAYILGATAVTEVFGDGQRLIAVALRYDRPVGASALDAALYSVEGRTVTRVYPSAAASPGAAAEGGSIVIVELSPDDAAAPLYVHAMPSNIRRPAAASVTIKPSAGAAASAEPANGPPDASTQPQNVATTDAINLVADDFEQGVFQDAETGDTLAYNLYVPKDRDPSKPLPLVLFMHDASVSGPMVDSALMQGLGAVSWASADDQARHPALVLAPQYTTTVVNDASEATSLLDTTLHLLDRVATDHNADRSRLYTTGQSMGGMMSIAMLVKKPDLFAAAFLVACQWDPSVVKPLARQKLWVLVSEGDEKASSGQNAIMGVIESEGTKIARATWSGGSTQAELAALVQKQASQGAPVNYTMLQAGTVVPEGQPDISGYNHFHTWRIAYTIPGIRDWIMGQSLKA